MCKDLRFSIGVCEEEDDLQPGEGLGFDGTIGFCHGGVDLLCVGDSVVIRGVVCAVQLGSRFISHLVC